MQENKAGKGGEARQKVGKICARGKRRNKRAARGERRAARKNRKEEKGVRGSETGRPRQLGPWGILITSWLSYFYISPPRDIKNPRLNF